MYGAIVCSDNTIFLFKCQVFFLLFNQSQKSINKSERIKGCLYKVYVLKKSQ